MALLFELTFAGDNWSSFGFTIVQGGIQGLDEMFSVRTDLEYLPGSSTPVYFGANLGEKHITVTGVVKGTSRSNLKTKLEQIKDCLYGSLSCEQQLFFGDDYAKHYDAFYDGTFTVRFIGSALHTSAALLTVGFMLIKDRHAA